MSKNTSRYVRKYPIGSSKPETSLDAKILTNEKLNFNPWIDYHFRIKNSYKKCIYNICALEHLYIFLIIHFPKSPIVTMNNKSMVKKKKFASYSLFINGRYGQFCRTANDTLSEYTSTDPTA